MTSMGPVDITPDIVCTLKVQVGRGVAGALSSGWLGQGHRAGLVWGWGSPKTLSFLGFERVQERGYHRGARVFSCQGELGPPRDSCLHDLGTSCLGLIRAAYRFEAAVHVAVRRAQGHDQDLVLVLVDDVVQLGDETGLLQGAEVAPKHAVLQVVAVAAAR